MPSRVNTDVYTLPYNYTFYGMGSLYVVETPQGARYEFFLDQSQDPAYRKSLDGGKTWGTPVALKAAFCYGIAVWYDRWSNIDADLIHVIYLNQSDADVYYRNINAADADTLSAETKPFAGSSAAAGCSISITRARGGNIAVGGCIDAGAEDFFYISTDAGGTWTSKTAVMETATTDQIVLAPGWAADNQDIQAFFWDASADEVSVKFYDDSANSWSETVLATSMVDMPAGSATAFSTMSLAVDITNSQNLIAAWSAVDTANADLRIWKVTEAAQTELTNVVTNSVDDQGMVTLGINTTTQDWYCIYCGSSDGAETYGIGGSVNVYYKVSTDDGSTWGSETMVTDGKRMIYHIKTIPRFKNPFYVSFIHTTLMIQGNVELSSPRATFQLGM